MSIIIFEEEEREGERKGERARQEREWERMRIMHQSKSYKTDNFRSPLAALSPTDHTLPK